IDPEPRRDMLAQIEAVEELNAPIAVGVGRSGNLAGELTVPACAIPFRAHARIAFEKVNASAFPSKHARLWIVVQKRANEILSHLGTVGHGVSSSLEAMFGHAMTATLCQ